jgi:hypothetical protein
VTGGVGVPSGFSPGLAPTGSHPAWNIYRVKVGITRVKLPDPVRLFRNQ